MSYILRAKRAWYEKAIGKRGTPLPYLLFEEGIGWGTPKAHHATKFQTTKAAGEAFDKWGGGRREDYECIPLSNQKEETIILNFR